MTKYTGVYLNQDQGDKWTAAEHDGTKWVSETKSADGDHATLGTTTDAAETDHTASGTVMKFLKGVLQTLKGILTTKIDQTTDGTTNRVVAKISQTAGENVVTLGGSLASVATLQNAVTANGKGSSLDVQGLSAAVFDVQSSGAMTATINFEGSCDDSVWSAIYATPLGSMMVSSTATTTGLYRASVAGLKSVRARISGYASGTITIKAYGSLVAVPEKVVQIAGSKNEIVRSSAAAPLAGMAASDYDIRDTNAHTYQLPHATAGVIEQSILIHSTLDQSCAISLFIYGYTGSPIETSAVFVDTIPQNGRFTLTPEKGLLAVDSATFKMFEIPELRNPHYSFGLRLDAVDTPTSGTVVIGNIRRY